MRFITLFVILFLSPLCLGNDTVLFESATLVASDFGRGDYFGGSVAVDGNVAVVGAQSEDEGGHSAGAAYVFELQDGAWVESAKLMASDAEEYDYFGYSVAVDVNVIVVGAYGEDEGGNNAGAAYVFELQSGEWVETAKLMSSGVEPLFGTSVAVSGNVIVVSVSGVWGGVAYVFDLQSGSWVETAKLRASDAEGEYPGGSVAVSGKVIVVGVDGRDEEEYLISPAYVFELEGGSWVETAKLIPSGGSRYYQGLSVALAGNSIVVGVRDMNHGGVDVGGAAYLFEKEDGAWVEKARLRASDPERGDYFGTSVAVSGDVIVVGAPDKDEGGVEAGAVYVFELEDGSWVETVKLNASDAEDYDWFGRSVAVSGNLMIAGAPAPYQTEFHVDGNGTVSIHVTGNGTNSRATVIEFPSAPSPVDEPFPLIPALAAGSAVTLIAIGAVWYRRRSPQAVPAEEPSPAYEDVEKEASPSSGSASQRGNTGGSPL